MSTYLGFGETPKTLRSRWLDLRPFWTVKTGDFWKISLQLSWTRKLSVRQNISMHSPHSIQKIPKNVYPKWQVCMKIKINLTCINGINVSTTLGYQCESEMSYKTSVREFTKESGKKKCAPRVLVLSNVFKNREQEQRSCSCVKRQDGSSCDNTSSLSKHAKFPVSIEITERILVHTWNNPKHPNTS